MGRSDLKSADLQTFIENDGGFDEGPLDLR